jgi:hypothetical protein
VTVNPFGHPDFDPSGGPGGQPTEAEQKLLAGKYKDPNELERGYLNLFSEGQRILEQKRALEAEIASMRSAASSPSQSSWDLDAGGVAEGLNPAERSAARRDPLDALSMAGIPVDSLQAFVRRGIQEELRPFLQGAQARQVVANEYPDFLKFEPEVAQFMEANPQIKDRYQRMYRADEQGAMEWAFNQFQRARAVAGQADVEDAVGNQAMTQRLDAMIPGSGDRSASAQVMQGAPSAEMERAWKVAQETGDWRYYLGMRVQIPDGHFKPLG